MSAIVDISILNPLCCRYRDIILETYARRKNGLMVRFPGLFICPSNNYISAGILSVIIVIILLPQSQVSPKTTQPSRGRPRSAPARTGPPLHRAHRLGTSRGLRSFMWGRK